jgi:prevent-host-death family protein
MKESIPYIIGIGELQRKASEVIKKLDSLNREGFIVSHNEPKAVLMSLKRYEKLKLFEEARRVEEEEVLALVKGGDREYERGETKKLKSLKELI